MLERVISVLSDEGTRSSSFLQNRVDDNIQVRIHLCSDTLPTVPFQGLQGVILIGSSPSNDIMRFEAVLNHVQDLPLTPILILTSLSLPRCPPLCRVMQLLPNTIVSTLSEGLLWMAQSSYPQPALDCCVQFDLNATVRSRMNDVLSSPLPDASALIDAFNDSLGSISEYLLSLSSHIQSWPPSWTPPSTLLPKLSPALLRQQATMLRAYSLRQPQDPITSLEALRAFVSNSFDFSRMRFILARLQLLVQDDADLLRLMQEVIWQRTLQVMMALSVNGIESVLLSSRPDPIFFRPLDQPESDSRALAVPSTHSPSSSSLSGKRVRPLEDLEHQQHVNKHSKSTSFGSLALEQEKSRTDASEFSRRVRALLEDPLLKQVGNLASRRLQARGT